MSPTLKMLLASSAVVITGLSLLAATNSAHAHPHDKKKTEIITETETLSDEDLNAHFERHAKSLREAMGKMKTESRILSKKFNTDDAEPVRKTQKHSSKRIDIIENPEELREAARSIENLLADSGILQSLADVVIELAEDIEIEDMGDGMRLSFDGKRIGSFSLDEDNDSLSINSLGKNTTIEKETYTENGKTKTRIIIETDSDDIDVDLIPRDETTSKRGGTTDF